MIQTYYINKKLNISIISEISISVISFYLVNKIMEWIVGVIVGLFHTKYLLTTAFEFNEKVIELMLKNYEKLDLNKTPVEVATLLNKKSEVKNFLGYLFNHITAPILEIMICSIMLFNIGFKFLGLSLIPFAIFYLLLNIQLIPKIKDKIKLLLNLESRNVSIFSGALEKANLANSFGTKKVLIEHLNNLNREETREINNLQILNELLVQGVNLFLTISMCLFFYIGAKNVEGGETTYGSFAALISILMSSFVQLKNLTFAFYGVNTSIENLKLHIEIIEKSETIKRKEKIKLTESNFENMELKDFTIKNNEKELFKINLKINSGEKFFLVGESGIGKTSLIKGLLGYKKYEGEILINGESINSFCNIFAWMPQNYLSMEGSISLNLKLGKENVTEDEMKKVIKEVYLNKKVEDLGGLDKDLTYNGNNFSGGENQRLSLARCFISENPVLLLDEPSSALDMNLEKEIFEKIMKSKKSGIIIVHRLKAIPKNSKVLFIKKENYKIGTLEEMIKDEDFKKLYFSDNVLD